MDKKYLDNSLIVALEFWGKTPKNYPRFFFIDKIVWVTPIVDLEFREKLPKIIPDFFHQPNLPPKKSPMENRAGKFGNLRRARAVLMT